MNALAATSTKVRRRGPCDAAATPLFEAADIASIASGAGLPLAPGAPAAVLASMLDRVFTSAVERRQAMLASPAQRRDALRKLIFPASSLRDAIAVAEETSPDIWTELAAAAEDAPAALALRRRFGRCAVARAFQLGPHFLSLLLTAAPIASAFPCGRGGPARKRWLRDLEGDLAIIFELMFGRSAATGEHFGAPAARFVRSLCRIIACAHHDDRVGGALAEIASLADATIAQYMRRAVTRSRRSPR